MRRLLAPLLAAFTGACAEDDEPFPAPYASDRGAYVEFLAAVELEAELDAIALHRIELSVAIAREDIGSDELRRMLLAARRRGIPIRAWLLLSDAEGYWPGEDNLPAFDALVNDFFDWNDENDLGVAWVNVDLEPPLPVSNELAAALEDGDLGQAVPVLLANVDRDEHLAARAAWAAAVDRWHDRGLSVACDAFGYVLDDFADGDPDLQDMFESPVEGIAWDEVGFLVYQILWQDADGNRLGPALVHSYSLTAVEQFGDRTAIALGTIGSTAKNTNIAGYVEPDAMRVDEAAALAAGASRVHLFSVDGMLAEGGVDLWLASRPAPATPEPTPAVEAQRMLISALD